MFAHPTLDEALHAALEAPKGGCRRLAAQPCPFSILLRSVPRYVLRSVPESGSNLGPGQRHAGRGFFLPFSIIKYQIKYYVKFLSNCNAWSMVALFTLDLCEKFLVQSLSPLQSKMAYVEHVLSNLKRKFYPHEPVFAGCASVAKFATHTLQKARICKNENT